MSVSSVLIQFLNGLASASSLFLVAAGLSLIFGVTRIVNFAHGSFFMLGMYLAVWFSDWVGFWLALPLAAAGVAAFGFLAETLLLRRIYRAPELLQLLATFALLLLIKDFALWAWGPEDLLGARAPGLQGAFEFEGIGSLAGALPEYDLFLVSIGPLILAALWLLLNRTRWGTLVRAASQDREITGALGVDQRWLFTSVFVLGALLAGLGGALQIPREPANLNIDLSVISDAFVVVVVGGLGSIPGAFLAALLIAEVKAFCIGLGFSKATLVMEFIIMAVVLIVRPWGLLGQMPVQVRGPGAQRRRLAPPSILLRWTLMILVGALALLPLASAGYTLVLLTDILLFALFAASLHFLMGPGGLYSFGHAAFFGIGAYAAGIFFLQVKLPMELALALAPLAAAFGALIFGWFCVRLSGVYSAMLTLAFAQIVWSAAFQWDALTGGSNGLVGVWPAGWLASKTAYYFLTLLSCALAIFCLWKTVYSPFGYALRAGRDSPLRSAASGIDVRAIQWSAFIIAGLAAGIGGALYAFSKGSISPEALGIQRSVDGLVMVMLGGIQTLSGPIWGAALFTWLQDAASRNIDYWRAAAGFIILVLVMVLPQGIGSLFQEKR